MTSTIQHDAAEASEGHQQWRYRELDGMKLVLLLIEMFTYIPLHSLHYSIASHFHDVYISVAASSLRT